MTDKRVCLYRWRGRSLPIIAAIMFMMGAGMSILQGCASVPYKPIPSTYDKTVVRVLGDGPSKMTDLPGGQYQIPNTQVFIYKVPSPEAQQASMAFGLLGVLASFEAWKEASKESINQIEDALRVDIVEETKRALIEALKQEGSPTNWVIEPDEKETNRFIIIPYIIMIVEGEIGRPFLFLKVKMTRPGDEETWANRFVYYLPDRRPIVGTNSWTENKGESFHRDIWNALGKTLNILLSDLKMGQTRHVVPGKLKGKFLGARKAYEVKGEILEETEDTIIFHITSRGVINGGINIIPRRDVEKMSP